MLPLLIRLVERSLVVAEEQDGEARYRLLETIRQYGEVKLAQAGETDAIRTRHRDWYLALAERAEPELRGPVQQRWLRRLEAEHDNLRAALTWSHAQPAPRTHELRLAVALEWFWQLHGHLSEGRRRLDEALATSGLPVQTSGPSPLIAQALYAAGSLARFQGVFPAARPLLEQSVAIRRRLGDDRGLAYALHWLGRTIQDQGEPDEARLLFEQSLALFRAQSDRWGLALALSSLGVMMVAAGDSGGQGLLEESLALNMEMGDPWALIRSMSHLANAEMSRGNFARAATLYEQGLPLSRELGNKRFTAILLDRLGRATWQQGDGQRAANLQAQAVWMALELGMADHAALSLIDLGRVAAAGGQPARAARLFGAAEALLDAAGAAMTASRRAGHGRDVTAVRATLGDAAFTDSWTEGRGHATDNAWLLANVGSVLAATTPATHRRAVPLPDGLTEREVEVLRLLAAGKSNREIAAALVLSVRTAERHIANLYAKIGAHGVTARVTATTYAVGHGLAEVPLT